MKRLLAAAIISACLFSCTKERMPAPPVPTADNTVYENVIYFDFNGGSVRSDSWNNGNEIQLQNSGMDEDRQVECINRVALYFSQFQVTITRDSAVYNSASPSHRQRVIVTQSSQWRAISASEIGAAVNSSFGTETPCFIFSNLVYRDPVNVSKVSVHEIGHTLGLDHQSSWDGLCNKTAEYRDGAIMGNWASDNANWTIGKSSLGCDSIQDDILRITIQFKLKH